MNKKKLSLFSKPKPKMTNPVASAPTSRATSTLEEEEDPPTPNIELNCSFTDHRDNFAERCTISNHIWTNDAAFAVRCGPNYKKYKKKSQSLPSLYDVVCVRGFKSNQRSHDITNMLPLPKHNSIAATGIPQLLIVQFCFPYEMNMFKKSFDGYGSEMTFYLTPSERLLKELENTPSPAVKLFQKWSQTCVNDEKMRCRFKCMGFVENLECLNLNWLKQYNGKPVLITESGSVMKHQDNILEMSVNIHKWSFLAKKSFVSLIPKFQEMQLRVGFTIEALEEDEMPECILGSVTLHNLDESTFLTIPPELQKV